MCHYYFHKRIYIISLYSKMNEFRIFFQIFLIIVFFSGLYVIFWLHKYHESFDDYTSKKYPDGTTITQLSNGNTITQLSNGTTITQLSNGSVITRYTNGTITERSPDGTITETSPNGTITETSPNGTITETSPNGTITETSPNGTITEKSPNGTITEKSPNGTITEKSPNKKTVGKNSYPITDENKNSAPENSNKSENSSQNLDDYILNNHPVEISPQSSNNNNNNHQVEISPQSSNNNNNHQVEISPQSSNNNDGESLPTTMAYPNTEYAAFDPLNEDINHYEYVAKEFASSQPDGLSDNPMDPNWGGVMYTQNMIKSGKYNDNNVNKPLLFQPKGIYIDNIPSAFGKPKDIY